MGGGGDFRTPRPAAPIGSQQSIFHAPTPEVQTPTEPPRPAEPLRERKLINISALKEALEKAKEDRQKEKNDGNIAP
jgi:hypothetical protein